MRLLAEVDQSFKQVRADIIRLLLLKENGGMWVDSSTFFIDKLNWIDRITTTDMPILNRISKEPELFTVYLDGYDMPNCYVFDEELNMNICLSPGI